MTIPPSVISVLVLAACARADQPQSPDAKAQEVLKAWAEYQGHLPAVTLRLRVLATCGHDDRWDDMHDCQYTVAIQRPDRLAIRAANDDAEIELVWDGAQMKVHLPQARSYAEGAFDKTVAALGARDWGQMFGLLRRYLDAPGFWAVLSDEPLAALSDAPQEARYVGVETVLGQKAHHLRMDVEGAPGDVWISEGGQPHLVRVTTSHEMINDDGPPVIVRRWNDGADYTFWTMPETVPSDRFEMARPPKTKEAENVKKALAANDVPLSPLPEGPTAELAWTTEGSWMAIAGDGETVVAMTPDGKLSRIDAGGRVTHQTDTGVPTGHITMVRLRPGGVRDFVAYPGMGYNLRAAGVDGAPLWTHKGESGIDCLATADLDGDGLDEIILGGEGVRVLGPDGKERWSVENPEWVRSVGVADWNGDGALDVLAFGLTMMSGRPQHRAFDRDGRPLGEIKSWLDAPDLTVVPASGDRAALLIRTGWSSEAPGFLEAVIAGGEAQWRLHLACDGDTVRAASTRPWVAVASHGRIWIIDADRGAVIGLIGNLPIDLDVAWLEPAAGEPLLAVLGERRVAAYRLLAK